MPLIYKDIQKEIQIAKDVVSEMLPHLKILVMSEIKTRPKNSKKALHYRAIDSKYEITVSTEFGDEHIKEYDWVEEAVTAYHLI